MNYSDRDRDIMVRTILGEAGRESRQGQAAVAHVLLNRTRDDRWGNSPADVALEPMQFSAWNEGVGGNSIPRSARPNDTAYQETASIVDDVLNGKIADPTGGATFYYSPAGMQALIERGEGSRQVPSWFDEETQRRGSDPVTIGGHIFTGTSPQAPNALSSGPAIETRRLSDGALMSTGVGPTTDGQFETQPMLTGGGGTDMMMGSSGGGTPPFIPQQDAPVLSTPGYQREDKGSIFDKVFGEGYANWMTPDRQDAMLALGTGLLSGDSWAEGIAAGGQNMMGVRDRREEIAMEQNAQERDREFQNAQLEMDQRRLDYQNQESMARAARATQDANTPSEYGRPFNVVGRDPETGREVVKSARLAGEEYLVQTDDGQWVNAESVMDDVHVGSRSEKQNITSGAGGIPNADFISEDGAPTFTFQRDSERQTYNYATRAINANRDLSAMIDHYGADQFTSVTDGLERWAANNSERSITPTVINSILSESGIQRQAATAMSRYLQALLRSDTGAAYTGEEINDYATTYLPRVGDSDQDVQYKRQAREQEIYSSAAGAGSAAPYLQGVIAGQYTLPGDPWTAPDDGPGALDSSNTETAPTYEDVEDILRKYE